MHHFLSIRCHWTKTQENNSYLAKYASMAIASCNSRVKLIIHVTARCALFNVKLHFLSVRRENQKLVTLGKMIFKKSQAIYEMICPLFIVRVGM